ncbi:DUF2771 family protein [Actinokineospora sp. NBRC 105648]|uniref:DUF2771 family protein n=1 Tax=Actinokineospora sp. NBRC 105648 TaxID=3032206 RepID=UPI0024A5B4BC|nr:DUF2771 family protein [Actinokineospora sp. NBRC 105648]GLZ42573.1 hypothetical protein Acsp05_61970 [Actinokineospora sp. NBRC 105648]
MRRSPIAVLACAAAVLAGCSTPPPPEVTFYSDGAAVNARPMIYCEIAKQACAKDEGAGVRLRTRDGKTVQISVPNELAASAWGVTFSYLTSAGEQVDGSSRIFTAESRQHAYTLQLPSATDRLLYATVQKLVFVEAEKPVAIAFWQLETER